MPERTHDPDPDRRLQVLLTEYEAARDDERATNSAMTALASVAVALLGAVVAVLVQDCTANESVGCWTIDPRTYTVLPLPPYILLTYGLFLSMNNSVRSYYVRLLERELRRLADVRAGAVPVPASGHLSAQMFRPRGKGRLWQVLLHGTWASLFVILAGVTVVSLTRVAVGWQQWTAGAFYALAIVVLAQGARRASFGAFAVWKQLHESLEAAFARPLVARESDRRRLTMGNVLVPRPGELVKFAFFPAGAAVGVLLAGDAALRWPVLVLGFVGFELLLYQARYLLNDIHGAHDDARHPRSPGRPDYTIEKNAVLGVLNLLVRLALALVVAAAAWLAWGASVGLPLVASYGAVVVTASLYEVLRRRTSRGEFVRHPTGQMWALYLLVGAGYGIRVALGASLAAGGSLGLELLLLAAVASALGTMFVTMTWALQTTKFRNPAPDEVAYPDNIMSKAHLIPLLRIAAEQYLEQRDVGDPETQPGPGGHGRDVQAAVPAGGAGSHGSPALSAEVVARVDGFDDVPPSFDSTSTPLQGSSSLKHPWNVGALVASTLAGGLGAALRSPTPSSEFVVGLMAGMAAGLVLVGLPRLARPVAAMVVIVAGASVWVEVLEPVLAAVPMAVVALVYVMFRRSSIAALETGPGQLAQFVSGVVVERLRELTRKIQAADREAGP